MIALMGHFFMEGTGTSPAARERAALRAAGRISGVRALQDIRSSKAVGEYLAPMGVEMHTWRVGRAYAAPRLREIDGLFGGELAGHYYFKDFFYSDSGIMASLIILDIVAELKRRGRSFRGEAFGPDGLRRLPRGVPAVVAEYPSVQYRALPALHLRGIFT